MSVVPEKKKYILGRTRGHPRAVNGRLFVHILVAEKALGHYLPPMAEVHHVDHDRSNNAPLNLVVCNDRSYHRLLHQRERALIACGNPVAMPCRFCGSYVDFESMTLTPRRRDGKTYTRAYHRNCRAAHLRLQRARGAARRISA